MRIRTIVAVGFIACAAVWAPGAEQAPKPTGLEEKVEKRLVQLDVGVEGDRDAIRAITAKEFTLRVGEREIQGLIVDRLCGDDPALPEPTPLNPPTVAPARVAAAPAVRPRATFVFFFDQTHLTYAGRALAFETARGLIDRLVVGGSRASIVSNGKRFDTFVALTDDHDKLIAGLERLRNDPRHWDWYAEAEEKRAQDVKDEQLRLEEEGAGWPPRPKSGSLSAPKELRGGQNTPDEQAARNADGAVRPQSCRNMPAKLYAREELIEARRSIQRLGFTLGALAEVSAPKALIYFGDTIRQKAGLHYLRLGCPGTPDLMVAETVPSASTAFDAVVNEALARGVHFFTIQAEGLLTYFPGWDTDRHQAAQDALVSLAAETGGEAFLGGASNDFIGRRIEARTSCALLLSFPPGDLPRDKTLGITIQLHAANVKIQSQGAIVVPSAMSIERARLLAAFVDPSSSDDGSLRALLIPHGGDGQTWKAAVQLRLRPSGLPDNSAELGASIVRSDKVTDHFASSIATASGSRAMVLEKSLDIAPGAFSIVAVARDVRGGNVGSTRLEVNWPGLARPAAAIAPIAVLQNQPAAISKDGEVSSAGAIARDVDEALDPKTSITLTSVVCRGARTKTPVVVERWFEGGSHDEFVPMTIAPTGDACLQTVDVAPAGRLHPGATAYHVVARVGDEIIAQERRTLRIEGQP